MTVRISVKKNGYLNSLLNIRLFMRLKTNKSGGNLQSRTNANCLSMDGAEKVV